MIVDSLPQGWAIAKTSETIETNGIIADGDWIESKDQDPNGDVRLIQLADIGDGDFRNKSERFMTSENAERMNCTFLETGDLLIARMPDPLGRACIFPGVGQKAVTVVDICLIRPSTDPALQSKLLMYWINTPQVRNFIALQATGTTRKRITRKKLEALELPIPPLAEQQQIAAKLDELLAQVDTLKTRLDTIPKILKRFRQSVLAAAVSGKLTEDWRGRNNAPSWQEQRLEGVCLSISDGDHQAPPRAKNGIPFLVISNISKGKLDFENVERWVPEDYYQSLKAVRIPKKNDILYTVTGSFGIPVIVDTDESFCFQRHIAIIKPNHEVVNFKFVQIILGSIQGLKQAELVATGTAQKTVSLNGLRNFVFDFPSYEEQTEIVTQVEQLFTYANQIEQRVKDAQTRVNHLTQAILAKAFRGELTAEWREQNPDLISGENSAEVLLAKIKVERESYRTKKNTRLVKV